MGQITALFVIKVLQAAEERVDRDALLRSVGIKPGSPVDPSFMISDQEYYAFLERVAAAETDPTTLPLRTGASMRCDDYGAFGLAWKSAVNLRGSYERAERYARVLSTVSTYQVERVNQGAYIHLHRLGERRLGMRLSNEATIASILSISREVSTDKFRPMAAYFKHPAPRSVAEHELYFGCPVIFNSDRDALLVSDEALQIPNKLGDAAISTFFEAHLENQLSRFSVEHMLHRQVRVKISQSLSEGVPRLSEIARQMGMSGRTLQRRLTEQGFTYQTLVEQSRHELAKELLEHTNYSLAEISFMTGFSEQSAFTRAFKRWSGQTPRTFRTTP